MTNSRIKVGSQVIAKQASGVNAAGERGVCYEVYQLGGLATASFSRAAATMASALTT